MNLTDAHTVYMQQSNVYSHNIISYDSMPVEPNCIWIYERAGMKSLQCIPTRGTEHGDIARYNLEGCQVTNSPVWFNAEPLYQSYKRK